MDMLLRRAIFGLRGGAQRRFGNGFPVPPMAYLRRFWQNHIGAKRLFQTQRLQNPRAIGRYLKPRANLFESCRLLENLGFEALMGKRQRGRKPANSAACYQYCQIALPTTPHPRCTT